MRAALLVALLTLAGCPCSGESPIVTEGFEQCSNLCGFVTPGGVTWVETVHPGEHGLALAPDTSLSSPIAFHADSATSVTVTATVNCGRAIQVRVVESQLVVSLPSSERHDSHSGFHRVSATVLLPAGSPTLGQLVIQNGAAACTLDDLVVSHPDPDACAG